MSSENNDKENYSSAKNESGPVGPDVYIVSDRSSRERGLGRVTNQFDLNVFGEEGLTPRAKTELKFAGLLLLFVFCFEFFAWFMLMNFIANRGTLQLSWVSIPAAVAAVVFAAVIWLYERQFMTADFSGPKRSLYLAVTIRLIIILGAALVTAQPLEVFIFDGQITRRAHEEAVILEAVSRYDELSRARAKEGSQKSEPLVEVSTVLSQQQEILQTQLSQYTQQLNQITGEIAESEAAKKQNQRARRWWRSQTEEEESRRKSALRSLLRRHNALEAKIANLKQQEQNVRDQIDTTNTKLTGVLARAEKKTDQRSQQLRDDVDKAELLARRHKRWIAQLKTVDPKAPEVVENLSQEEIDRYGWAPFVFAPAPYDFFERLRVIEDLRAGKAPQWPVLPEDRIKEIADELDLEDPTLEQRAGRGHFFERSYWAVFFVALVIPMLAVAFKLAMPMDLKNYYSLEYQAERGNPAAVEARYVQAKILAKKNQAKHADLKAKAYLDPGSHRYQLPPPQSAALPDRTTADRSNRTSR